VKSPNVVWAKPHLARSCAKARVERVDVPFSKSHLVISGTPEAQRPEELVSENIVPMATLGPIG
jgi:hypothetical protein